MLAQRRCAYLLGIAALGAALVMTPVALNGSFGSSPAFAAGNGGGGGGGEWRRQRWWQWRR